MRAFGFTDAGLQYAKSFDPVGGPLGLEVIFGDSVDGWVERLKQ